jgi:microcystin-dependent protein
MAQTEIAARDKTIQTSAEQLRLRYTLAETYVSESALTQALDDLLAEPQQPQSLPPGLLFDWTTDTVPTGYLAADGSAVGRETYAELFAAVGTAYGIGDGSTTFNLPDARGRVTAGYDASQAEFDALGETGGEKTHTLTVTEMPAHSHNGYGSLNTSGGSVHTNYTGTGPGNWDGYLAVYNTGGGGAHNNLQPYIVTKKIIKY